MRQFLNVQLPFCQKAESAVRNMFKGISCHPTGKNKIIKTVIFLVVFLEGVKTTFVFIVETVFSEVFPWAFPAVPVHRSILLVWAVVGGTIHSAKARVIRLKTIAVDGDRNGNAKCMDSHGFQSKNFTMMV